MAQSSSCREVDSHAPEWVKHVCQEKEKWEKTATPGLAPKSGPASDLQRKHTAPTNEQTASGNWPADFITSWNLNGLNTSNGSLFVNGTFDNYPLPDLDGLIGYLALNLGAAAFSKQVIDGTDVVGVRFVPSPCTNCPPDAFFGIRVAVTLMDPRAKSVFAAPRIAAVFFNDGTVSVVDTTAPFQLLGATAGQVLGGLLGGGGLFQFASYTPGQSFIELSVSSTGQAQLIVDNGTPLLIPVQQVPPLPFPLTVGVFVVGDTGDAVFDIQLLTKTKPTTIITTTPCPSKVEAPCNNPTDAERKWDDSVHVTMPSTSPLVMVGCAALVSFALVALGIVLGRRSSIGGHGVLSQDPALLEMDAEAHMNVQ